MKLRTLLVGLALLAGSTFSFGQNSKSIDLSLGFGPNNVIVAPSFVLKWGVLNERVAVGTGLRMSYLSTSDAVFGNETYGAAADNLYKTSIANLSTASFNIPIYLSIRPFDKIYLGANIDVIGLTFGGNASGQNYITKPDGDEVAVDVSASTFNLMLGGGANDIGSLNSEFYLGYRFTNFLSVRAGYTLFFSEVTLTPSAAGVTLEEDKLRQVLGLGFVAVNYRFMK